MLPWEMFVVEARHVLALLNPHPSGESGNAVPWKIMLESSCPGIIMILLHQGEPDWAIHAGMDDQFWTL